ncbi:MAG: hypothetical protein PHQ23_16780 [Candidatus Wallbacteria bacterium]|nr:hypothetical protein [Candidatus Wallbacteria bacterium]
MSQGRIPVDIQEFIVFIREFSNALKQKSHNDKFLVKCGTSLGSKVDKLFDLDEEARQYAALKSQTNEKKYRLKDEILVDASRAVAYLEFKLGKTAKQMEDYNIRTRPKKETKTSKV